MSALCADQERGLAFLPLEVRCGRGAGVILLTPQGDFIFKPHPRRSGFFNWLSGLLWPAKKQHIPADQLLGAQQESPAAFTVWYAAGYTSQTGSLTKQRFKACKTPRFETNDTAASSALVDHLRRSSSWWGRSRPPHIAAIVNPVSGRGAAVREFNARLLPLLRDVAGLRVSVHTTQARMHAAEIVRGLPLRPAGRGTAVGTAAAAGGADGGGGGVAAAAGADGRSGAAAAAAASRQQPEQQPVAAAEDADGVDLVMFVGGDGTFYEGLQGLFQRPDWDAARQVPFAAVPCGSGNGLAASTGLWDPVTAVVAACRGRREPVDVASVLQPPGNRFYCVLSVVYGSMANLDIGTNHLRWMGELRFHLGGLWELIRGRCYACRVFVLPPPNDPRVVDGAVAAAAAGGGIGGADGGRCVSSGDVMLSAVPGCGDGASAGTGVDSRDCEGALAGQRDDTAAAAGAQGTGGVVDRGAGGGEGVGMEERLLPGGGGGGGSAGESSAGGRRHVGSGAGLCIADYPPGPPLPLLSQLPSLPRPLPDSPSALPTGWVQLADAFAIFGAYNTQHLALGARSNPGGRMADGAWEVWHLQADGRRASGDLRKRCLKVLLGVEDGSFAKTPGVMSVIKARALMFEQRDSSTWTVLDGEEVPDLPLYLEVHPGLATMLVAPGFREEGLR